MEPFVHPLYEAVTGTWQFVVADPQTRAAAIIDPVLDYDKEAGSVSTKSADALIKTVEEAGYHLTWILETHAHADHLSSSRYLQNVVTGQTSEPPKVGIGKRIQGVQKHMSTVYDIPSSDLEDAFDRIFEDDEIIKLGNLDAKVIALPGHTPDHVGYIIGSNVFAGDSVFNPDVGSARCDFPGGSAEQLYGSIQKLLSLPDHYKLYTGHDYPPSSREAPAGPLAYTLVADQKTKNKHVKEGTDRAEFIKWRSERDSGLSNPRLLVQAMHVNLRGGRLPATSLPDFKLTDIPSAVARVSVAQ